MISDETRIMDLTVGQLRQLITETVTRQLSASEPKTDKQYIKGLTGIMELFGCSQATAYRLKEGKLKDAVTQSGRLILIDKTKAIELFNK